MKENLAALLLAVSLSVAPVVTPLCQNKVGGSVSKESDAIDLGLSVKWAPWNIGASKPSDYGEYFMWGEITPKKEADGNCRYYGWNTYSLGYFADMRAVMLKYNDADGKTTLEPSDDAAAINWGGKWRMPTQAELAELSSEDNCEWAWIDNYNESGHSGYVIKSKQAGYEGVFLFLPAAGYWCYSDLYDEGASGFYWSQKLFPCSPNYANNLSFNSGGRSVAHSLNRCFGFSVRAVCPL